MAKRRLTADQIRGAISYDPEAGVFLKRLAPSRRNPTERLVPTGYLDAKGYLRISILGVEHPAHRVAWVYMTGEWPKDQIDHIDLVKSNNRWSNLREANNSQNQANTPAKKTNPSGLKGAHRAAKGLWTSRIRVNGARYFLGLFPTPEEAHQAYRNAAIKLNPEFGRAA